MRRVNLWWAAGLMITVVVAGGVTHFLHRYQMTRIASAFLREGRRAQEEKRPDAAIRYLRSYVTLLPNDIEGLALYGQQLADLAIAQKQPSQNQPAYIQPAYLTLEKVIRVQPERAETRRTLVPLAILMRRYPEALKHLEKLLDQSPQDGELWEWQAGCQIAQAEYDLAKETLESAIIKAPERLECYGLLASLLYTRFKSPEKAMTCIDQMVSNNPEKYQAYLNRGQWRMQLLNVANESVKTTPAEATAAEGSGGSDPSDPTARAQELSALVADVMRARELAPEEADTLAFAARVALMTQAYDEARKYVQSGLELHPTDPRFYLALADVETVTANATGALDALRRGVAAVPKDHDLGWNLANRLIDLGMGEEASAAIEQLRSAGLRSELIGYLEARTLIRRSQWMETIERLESARPRLLDRPELVRQADVMLALAYRETDAADQQLTCLRRAVDQNPRWIPARMGLAELLLSANFVQQAAEEFRRVLALPEAPAAAGIELARCLSRLNARKTTAEQDWSEFDKILNRVESQSPKSVPVLVLRAEKLTVQGLADEASQLVAIEEGKNAEDIDLWTVQIALAQQARNWENIEQLLQAAEEQFGQNVTLRILKGRYLVQRYGIEASDHLKKVSQPAPTWSKQENFLFHRNFTALFLAIGEYDEAERMGRLAAESEPEDLAIRLLVFDVALRANRPQLMEQVLHEVEGITGPGPLWHYGEAVHLVLLARLEKDQKPLVKASLDKARSHLIKAKALRPTWARIPVLLAEIETQQGDINAVTTKLLEAIDLGERNPVILSRTVSLLSSQKRYSDADKIVRRLQESQNLFNGDMIRSASEISMRLNDRDRALDLAEQMVRDSDNARNQVWLAQVLGSLGKYEEAEQQLRKAIETDGSDPEPWIVLVQILTRSNQRDKAEQVVAEAEQAMAADKAPLAIAQCYEMLGKADLARSKYQAALEQASDDKVVLRRVVEFQMRSGLSAEAEPLLRNILQSSDEAGADDRRWATQILALALAMNGSPERLNEGLALIEKNLATESASPADERVKALILTRQPSTKEHRDAIAIFERLLARDSDTSVEDRFLLARLYLGAGDQPKGRAELRKLLATNSKDPRFIVAYLPLLLKSGETTEAELWLDRLQALAPNDPLTADFQAQVLFAKKTISRGGHFHQRVGQPPPARKGESRIVAGTAALGSPAVRAIRSNSPRTQKRR